MPERHVYDTRPRQRLAWLAVLAVGGLGLLAMAKGCSEVGANASPSSSSSSSDSSDSSDSSAVPATTTTVATGLNPGLVAAFEQASAAAADAGHNLTITDGFRTTAQQQALFEAEVQERGSVEEALRWVLPPDQSMHVQGLAVDVGDGPAADWLLAEGDRFGLCRTLEWEWWHFEWRPEWESSADCPAPARAP